MGVCSKRGRQVGSQYKIFRVDSDANLTAAGQGQLVEPLTAEVGKGGGRSIPGPGTFFRALK